MKKFFCLIIATLVFLSGCGVNTKNSNSSINNSVIDSLEFTESQQDLSFRGVWFSYIELNFVNYNEDEFKSTISTMFQNVKDAGFSAVICQVRANCDAIYPSVNFPFSSAFTGTAGVGPSYDPLEIMVNLAHNIGLEFHAWINPYRVSAKSKDYENLPNNSPVYKYLTDDDNNNDKNVLFTDEGMYLNPASSEVRKLIVDGINEILATYDVDGIQFDDYFYPTTDAGFDKVSYEKYKKSVNTPLSLDNWRRTNVNILLSEVYNTVHKTKGCVFGVSPAADISNDKSDKNYSEFYADVEYWCSTSGYIDYIAPQLYFGYEYPEADFCYDTLLENWCKLNRDDNVKLYIGLAAYKVNNTDATSDEWIKNRDILSRQLKDIKSSAGEGIILYSYSYLFSENEHNRAELDALKKEMN